MSVQSVVAHGASLQSGSALRLCRPTAIHFRGAQPPGRPAHRFRIQEWLAPRRTRQRLPGTAIRRSACTWRGRGGPKHYAGEQAKGVEITRKESAT
jgi:hypothetical protein